MELSGFTPNEAAHGDRLPAKEAADKPLIVQVREHRDSVVTAFAPEGKPGIVVDVVDLTTDSTYHDVLWMNGAIVDGLSPHVAKTMPVKLVWTPGKSGYPYLSPAALEGKELELAAAWASKNPTRLDDERKARGLGAKQAPAPAAKSDADVDELLKALGNK